MKLLFAITKIITIIATAIGNWRKTKNAIGNSETKSTAKAYDKVTKASKVRSKVRRSRNNNNNASRRESSPGRLRKDKYQRD